MSVNQEKGQIIIEKAASPLADIDASFAQQLNEFIEQYRPALEVLAE